MATTTQTRLTINISPDFHDELKMQAISHGKTLKDYVIEALMYRIQHDTTQEDKIWGQMSEEAKKEGFLSVEESETLLMQMENA